MKKTNTKIVFLVVVLALISLGTFAYFAHADDIYPPTVVATFPRSGADGVSSSIRISITFSEAMDPSTLSSDSLSLTDSGGDTVQGQVGYSNRTASFVPLSQLDGAETYTMTVSGWVRDISGNAVGDDYSWSFSTQSD